MIRSMIDREQVLHVARLARLRLTDDEIERMAAELSGILEHVDRISELDLDGVEPTSHVIALENVLRPDEPAPELVARRGPRAGAGPGLGLLPRPLAAGVGGDGARRADRAHGRAGGRSRIRSGELAADEYFDAYREAAAGDSLNAFLWTAEDAAQVDLEGPAAEDPPTPTARWRDSGGGQGHLLHRGHPDDGGLADPGGLPPAYDAARPSRLREAGARVLGKANMDEFAMGSSNENSGYEPVLNPWDSRPRPGRVLGGARRRGRGTARAVRDRHRHRVARSASRPRSAGSSA